MLYRVRFFFANSIDSYKFLRDRTVLTFMKNAFVNLKSCIRMRHFLRLIKNSVHYLLRHEKRYAIKYYVPQSLILFDQIICLCILL